MTRRSKTVLVLVPLLVLVLVGALFHEQVLQFWQQWTAGKTTGEESAPEKSGTPAGGPSADAAVKASAKVTGTVPRPGEEAGPPSGTAAQQASSGPVLPPSPPLPDVLPEADQASRKEAFALKQSVDRVVRPDEPFEAAGKQWTVNQMLGRPSTPEPPADLVPKVEEHELGRIIRKPIQSAPARPGPAPSAYYGIRIVRPGENLWNIHYAIIREYLDRRDIHLPASADEPLSDGHSSGVGRLLKFLERVVQVYDTSRGGIARDLNEIHPDTIIVFFNISELFAAMDRIQYADIRYLRFVSNSLLIDAPDNAREVVDRRSLK